MPCFIIRLLPGKIRTSDQKSISGPCRNLQYFPEFLASFGLKIIRHTSIFMLQIASEGHSAVTPIHKLGHGLMPRVGGSITVDFLPLSLPSVPNFPEMTVYNCKGRLACNDSLLWRRLEGRGVRMRGCSLWMKGAGLKVMDQKRGKLRFVRGQRLKNSHTGSCGGG